VRTDLVLFAGRVADPRGSEQAATDEGR